MTAAFQEELELIAFDTNPEDLTNVSCPDDLELEEGLEFECELSAGDDSGPCELTVNGGSPIQLEYYCEEFGGGSTFVVEG